MLNTVSTGAGIMIESLAHIRLSSHCVHIAQDGDSGLIHCFKYNNHDCQFEQFDNQFDAADFILEPLPLYRYVFKEE